MASEKVTIWKCDRQGCSEEVRTGGDDLHKKWSQMTSDGRVLDLCNEHAREWREFFVPDLTPIEPEG